MADAVPSLLPLLRGVAAKLAGLPSSTDHLMLTKWRVLSICQHLLGQPPEPVATAGIAALRAFASSHPRAESDELIQAAIKAARTAGLAGAVLPEISPEKRSLVRASLEEFLAQPDAVTRALAALPQLRQRMDEAHRNLPLTGLAYRFKRTTALLEDGTAPDATRRAAAAAILYLDRSEDVISDDLGAIGLMDDDYAFRVTLEDHLDPSDHASISHWSEKICALWDDLPFLQGINLYHDGSPLLVSWLDRLNSYTAYYHALRADTRSLVLLQPTVVSSPLHLIVSLLGLLVLEAITSTGSQVQRLRVGQTYEVDGKQTVRFLGIDSSDRSKGWLRLGVRDGVVLRPPGWADRMVPIAERRLSVGGDFPAQPPPPKNTMQGFFGWDAAIGPAALPQQLVLVTSKERAVEMMKSVSSNGVALLEHGLVRFVTMEDEEDLQLHGTLLFVVPSLGVVRSLQRRGIRLQCVIVDGYGRLSRDRHELPFIAASAQPPAIVLWAVKGYYPSRGAEWLDARCLAVGRDDIEAILAAGEAKGSAADAALRQSTVQLPMSLIPISLLPEELALLEAIHDYANVLRSTSALPPQWVYLWSHSARTLALLAGRTPAQSRAPAEFGRSWLLDVSAISLKLRPDALRALGGLRTAEAAIIAHLDPLCTGATASGRGLATFVKDAASGDNATYYFVCSEREQLRAANDFMREERLSQVQVVTIDALPPCADCIVAGWTDCMFAAQLFAHAPRSVRVLGADADGLHWAKAASLRLRRQGQSLVDAVSSSAEPNAVVADPNDQDVQDSALAFSLDDETNWTEQRVPCVFLWLAGQSEAKALARQARVVVDDGELIKEREAVRLVPGDRVIIGSGVTRWSPEEDFTDAVVEAVRASQPGLVASSGAWRKALLDAKNSLGLTSDELRTRLAALGVSREVQTLEGWLNLDRRSPIAPRSAKTELAAMWPLIGAFTKSSLDEIIGACRELRELRETSGRALLRMWKGEHADLGIEQSAAQDLVARLRSQVQVYEVEKKTFGEIPASMLGRWLPTLIAEGFEVRRAPDARS